MIDVLIVDDEQITIDRIKRLLKDIEDVRVTNTFTSPEKCLVFIEENRVQLAFVDIDMPGMTGLELAKRMSGRIEVIFVTAYETFALEAFDAGGVGYVLKPVRREMLAEQIQRYKARRSYQESSLPKLTVRCFGGYEVRGRREGDLINFRTEKARQLFAYLLVHNGRPVAKYRLLDIFWRDMDEKKANSNLYTTWYNMKKCLGEFGLEEVLIKKGNMYSLDFSKIDCDFLRFMHLCGNKEMHREAMGVYKGDLFGGCCYSWVTGFSMQAYERYRMLHEEAVAKARRMNDREGLEALERKMETLTP